MSQRLHIAGRGPREGLARRRPSRRLQRADVRGAPRPRAGPTPRRSRPQLRHRLRLGSRPWPVPSPLADKAQAALCPARAGPPSRLRQDHGALTPESSARRVSAAAAVTCGTQATCTQRLLPAAERAARPGQAGHSTLGACWALCGLQRAPSRLARPHLVGRQAPGVHLYEGTGLVLGPHPRDLASP